MFLVPPKARFSATARGKAGGGGGPTDPDFSSVALLLHMEGTNGSTTFTDSSSNARTVTAVGNAQISTTRSKYGSASCLLDGSGDLLSTTVAGGLGAGDFTIELWFYATTLSLFLFNNRTGGVSGDGIDMLGDGRMTTSGGFIFSTALTYTQDTWNHLAITRQSGTFTRWLNGSSTGTSVNSTDFSGSTFQIGGNNNPSGNAGYLNGNIDEVRITIGVARYTSSFTPPTGPFPDS